MINFKIFAATVFISSSASAGILTFENLPSTSNSTHRGQAITDQDTIDGFQFVVTSTLDGPNSWAYYNVPNPYLNSVNPAYTIGANGTTAMFSGYYENTSSPYTRDFIIARPDWSLWKFNQVVLTSVWAMGRVELLGYRNGQQVSYLTQNISNTQQTMVSASGSEFGANAWIDFLIIRNYVGAGVARDFIMDDMYYTLPAPGAFALMGCGLIGFRTRRR